ncbi:MAG: F0F1 ATP synthase subunit gamma [Sphingopyxis sp.]
MATLKELKGRIASVKSTQKITKAKKMVASAKLRRAQLAAENGRPYASRLEAVVASIAGKVGASDGAPKLLSGTGKDDVHMLLVLNSDRGLAGAFNSNIVKAARDKANELKTAGKTVKFMLVGRKGRPVINRLFPNHIAASYDTTAYRELTYANAAEISAQLLAMYDAGAFDVAHLFFSRFRSALLQEATGGQIIPVAMDGDEAGAPATGTAAVEYEPDEEEILAELLPRNVTVQIFKGLLENGASEQGASMTAMDNATRNAGDLINKLTIVYNRTRQAAITKELIEIISGAEAL